MLKPYVSFQPVAGTDGKRPRLATRVWRRLGLLRTASCWLQIVKARSGGAIDDCDECATPALHTVWQMAQGALTLQSLQTHSAYCAHLCRGAPCPAAFVSAKRLRHTLIFGSSKRVRCGARGGGIWLVLIRMRHLKLAV